MRLIKGKSYVLFGNFPNPEKLQQEMFDKLGIKVVCVLNNVDTTVAMEYVENPTPIKNKRGFISKLFK